MVAEDFIAKCKRIHGTMYDYTQSVYVNERTKITATCHKNRLVGRVSVSLWSC